MPLINRSTCSLLALGLLLAACGNEPETTETADDSAAATEEATGDSLEAVADADAEATPAPAPAGVDYAVAESGTYTPDDGHAYIVFSYNHLGFSNPMVRWGDWDANLNWDADNPENSTLDVTIDATSVDTGVDDFNTHLNSSDFFNTAEYPQISFTSTALEVTGPESGILTGDLTIRDTTMPVTMDVTINKAGFEERGNVHKLGFSGRTTVLRSDFGLDAYVPNVSDEVDIIVEAEFEKPA
ncbi:YceI family protein [Aquisalinus flavus]|uniref:Polyisoprenoid-binding protein n=1 Tax=Aquisalinus flavus TaxID=1526572 RepID=A0A8J2Y664_9PROT|nr:YceI family protein [Aquisalinus flavus]MBD0427143.1 YceI family protein [Aquisalinus flavus]UNE46963.1 YceI family protein [Aquisalinus flavus]GGC98696.1 polyisoprenoid-binding protein [Aquisalinus flavus]